MRDSRHYDSFIKDFLNGDHAVCAIGSKEKLMKAVTKGVCGVKKKFFYGRNLFIARINKGLDTKQLAEMIGITDEHLNNIEQERVKPSIQTIVKLANALDVAVEVFFE